MKNKLYTALFLALGIGFASSSAFAQEAVELGSKITDEECEVLEEDVMPALSKNVHAAYNCSEAANLIVVAACHETGRKKAEKVSCAIIGQWGGDDGDDAQWNDSTCNAAGDDFTTGPEGKGFIGSNAGGSVAAAALEEACTSDGGDAAAEEILPAIS